MFASNWTVGKKFAFTGSLLMVLCAVLGLVALTSVTGLVAQVNAVSNEALAGVARFGQVEAALNEMRGDVLKHIGSDDPSTMRAAEANIGKLRALVAGELSAYAAGIASDEERERFAKVQPALERYYAVCDAVLEVSRSGQHEAAYKKYENESIKTGIYRAAKAAVQDVNAYNRQRGRRLAEQATASGGRARMTVWLLLVSTLVCGSVLLGLIVRGINRTLGRVASELSQGADQLSHAAAQVAASSQSLAQGSSEQAASLEETSSSLESMSSMTKQASENAHQADGLAQHAKGAAVEGGAAMAQIAGAMEKIRASAEGTSQIIKDINEIA
jgi:methyl-accepting chemotaxis protein